MEVFFYGMFMDIRVLREQGIEPSNPRKGYLRDYVLKIGDRASLTPCKNEKSYGVVMTLDEDAVHRLYNQVNVADYLPEEVQISIPRHGTIKAICYNLPAELVRGVNQSYAESLYKLAKEQGFPEHYVTKIKQMSKT